jgi:hypothetical protein
MHTVFRRCHRYIILQEIMEALGPTEIYHPPQHKLAYPKHYYLRYIPIVRTNNVDTAPIIYTCVCVCVCVCERVSSFSRLYCVLLVISVGIMCVCARARVCVCVYIHIHTHI